MVDHTYVYSGPVEKIKELVDRGELGDVSYYDSTRINLGLFQSDVSVIWDLAVHDLSILHYVLGRRFETVQTTGARTRGSAHESVAHITLGLAGGIQAHLNVSWIAPVKIRATILVGDRKMLVYNDLKADEAIRVYDRGVVFDGDCRTALPADLDAFRALAARRGVRLVEDAACAIGSRIGGRPIGADSPAAAFSFHPRKLLVTGEGGMIVTREPALARRLRSLRHHGVNMSDFERHGARGVVIEAYGEVGYNFRMTDLQAAVGCVQLGRVEEVVARRIAQAERYSKAFAGHPHLVTPHVPPGVTFNYQTYCLRLGPGARLGRDALMQALWERGIATRRGIMATHREPAYRPLPLRVPLPNTEALDQSSLVLPLFHALEPADQDRVIEAVLALL
jgi:hypothetical protein